MARQGASRLREDRLLEAEDSGPSVPLRGSAFAALARILIGGPTVTSSRRTGGTKGS